VAQVICVGTRLLDPRLLRRKVILRLAPAPMQRRHLRGHGAKPAKGIQQGQVLARIRQGPVIMLAMDLDEMLPHLAQQLHRHWLVVDRRPRLAIGQLHPAQDEIAIHRDVGTPRRRPGGVAIRHVEHRRHLALRLTGANERSIAPPPQRQRESIEQDRFSGTRFARQHKQTRLDRKVETVDQHDVADREPGEHEALLPRRRIRGKGSRAAFPRTGWQVRSERRISRARA
jgi:hypothetical protein